MVCLGLVSKLSNLLVKPEPVNRQKTKTVMTHILIEGDLAGAGLKLAIVVGKFNSFIGEPLLQGALEVLKRASVSDQDITIAHVPGAFEIPLIVKKFAETGEYDGVIALGAVIRGETPHFDFVAGECARGLNSVQLDTGVPVGFGVLTVDTIEQAIQRAQPDVVDVGNDDVDNPVKHIVSNKGAETTVAVLEMINILAKV